MSQPAPSSLLAWLWRSYLHRHRWLMAAAFAFMAIEGAMFGFLSYMMKPMFDDVFIGGNTSALTWVAFTVMGIFTLRAVASVSQKTILARVSQASMGEMRGDMLDRLMAQDLSWHQKHGAGHLIQRVEGDVASIAQVWNTLITGAGRDVVSLISLFTVAIVIDWRWTAFALVGFPLLIWPVALLQRYLRANARVAREVAAQLSDRLSEVFIGVAAVKLNRLESWQARKYRDLTERRIAVETRSVAGQASLPGLVDVMSGIGFVAVLMLGAAEILDGRKTVGDFMAFFTAIGLTFEPLRRLGAVSGVWEVAAASIERIREILDAVPHLRDPADPFPPPSGMPDIELRDVHLSYDGAPALQGLSLRAEAGQTTALVGASGAGKSTVFNLLTRLVDPDQGAVEIGSIPVSLMRLSDLRGMISVVTQEAMLFDETLRENVTLDSAPSEDRLSAALEAAHVTGFLPQLDKGLDSAVGPRGTALSGGQRQRVAIARALLRDTPVLLLDEATSALDSASEAVVQDALEQLSLGRTTLVIAHRLSTVRNADKIIVLDQGRVIEEGTHDSLLAQGGAYRKLYDMQFKDGPG